jgi:hypothetical protein
MAKASNVLGSLAIVCLIAGAGYYLFVMDDGVHDPLNREAELNITVRAIHLWGNADFSLYVDGTERASGTLGPSDEELFVISVNTKLGRTIEIKATSEGGGFGPQSPSKSVRIWSSSSHNILLLV